MKFHLPTKIIFGREVFSELEEVVEQEFHVSKILLVTDKGIMNSGIGDRVLSRLKSAHVFDEVESNPKSETINKGGELAQEINPDLVVGLGGGSSLDAAKAIALLSTNRGAIEDYEGREKYKTFPLPVLAIPTTCGTGSEVTWVSVITDTKRRFKMSIKGSRMYPAVALVDPDLLISLPPHLIASTGMDALTHAVEAYTAKVATFTTDIFAKESCTLIFSSIERAFKDVKGNIEAREKMMLGSMLAGIAFGNSDVGAVHCLAEAIGGLCDLPHGVLNSIFLPLVMEFNLPVVEDRYAEIAKLTGISTKNKRIAAQELIEKIKILSHSLLIPSLKDLGLNESQFSVIARNAFQNNSNPYNPREAQSEDYREILVQALNQ
ncbi:MAG: iron-containing alcohol dehydrogenase family protein [Candidatus Aminicenantaceae bacterium]